MFLGSSPFSGYEDGAARALRRGVGASVHFLPSVPLDELLGYTADADVGVSLLQDTCENHRLALPNKVFEYVAAGVPVVVSDLPELRRLVEAHGIGWTPPDDPEQLAAALSTAMARTRPNGTARLWHSEARRLLDLYELMGRRRSASAA